MKVWLSNTVTGILVTRESCPTPDWLVAKLPELDDVVKCAPNKRWHLEVDSRQFKELLDMLSWAGNNLYSDRFSINSSGGFGPTYYSIFVREAKACWRTRERLEAAA